jgi:hypothetical protein
MGMIQLGSRGRTRLSVLGLLVAPGALALGCGDDITNHYDTHNYYTDGGAPPEVPVTAGKAGSSAGKAPVELGGEGGMAPVDLAGAGGAGGADPGGAGGTGGDDSGIDPRYPDAPVADTALADFELDIFGTVGNRYWFAVSDEQRKAMNGNDQGGGCCFQDGLYTPGGSGKANWVDHLFVTTAGDAPQTADYGKVQAKVVGQYSRFPWEAQYIPNLNIDADQFVEEQRIAGYEHLRFSNGQRGSIFRDKLAYDLYRMLDYPAPLATWVWVESNVWGPNVSIPYTLVERYKRTFCDRYADAFGGGCPNMWEYAGSDFNQGDGGGGKGGPILAAQFSAFDDPNICQMGKCDATRVKELEAKLGEAPRGEGFKAALVDYIDWPAFHRFQCLSWALSTGDDTLHNSNNSVLVERADGKFQYLPYSIDLSMGSYGHVPLRGQNVLATRCQEDPTCWADTLTMCEDVVNDLTTLKPNEYLASLYQVLEDNGMLRPGDEANFQGIDTYFNEALVSLPAELELYKSGTYCEYPYVNCGGQCILEWECSCQPPPKEPIPGAGGAGAVGGGAVGGGAVGGGAVGGGEPIPGGDIGAGGGGPIICPVMDAYKIAQ